MTETAVRRVLLLVYESFADFEISILATVLRGSGYDLRTVGLSPEPATSTGGLRVVPDLTIDDLDPEAVDALVVPGGDATRALGDERLREVIRALDGRGGLLAAICGGPAVLADAGVLDYRRYTAALEPGDSAYPFIEGRGHRVPELVVTDGHVVTATGSSYLAFAEEVLRHLSDAADVEPLTFFREPSLG